MATIKPFKGIRPNANKAEKIASLPYDVMNRNEAKTIAQNNDMSFLHVVRAEIDLDENIDAYDDQVYTQSRTRLDEMIEHGDLIQDDEAVLYIYRQVMNGRSQTGLVGCTSIDEYINDTIKKHEFTRETKEIDRIKHFDKCEANTAPIFLTYRKNDKVNLIIDNWIENNEPIYEFVSQDDITHIVWKLDNKEQNQEIVNLFADIEYLYIADGHHRSASAVKVGQKRRLENPNYNGTEEFNYFLSVLFPDEDLFIMDYNRVVKDLNGHTEADFLKAVEKNFELTMYEENKPYSPQMKHEYGMYLNENWYKLKSKVNSYDINDTVKSLDASILQENLLSSVLGIKDPRTDNRIDFVGGIRGLKELEKRVKTDMKVAFSVYPTTIEDLMKVADDKKVMPPKSTWFEPKLRSGLFVHRLF